MSYLRYLCLIAHSVVQHILTVWVTWWVSYKRQELFALLRVHGSTPDCGDVRLAPLFSFLCVVLFLFVLYFKCWQILWIVHSCLSLRFSLACHCNKNRRCANFEIVVTATPLLKVIFVSELISSTWILSCLVFRWTFIKGAQIC